MKRENNKKFKKRKRNQNRSLTCRVLSMMFAIVLFCSTVLINTDYVSQASSFDDMVDMVEVEEDSAAVDTSEDTGDDLGTDVNFESEEGSAETYSESDDFGSSDADFSSGENMFTDGTSESSAPAEEAAQPVSCIVNLKNETIEIKAEAPAGVLPNGTQMIVNAVENNTEDAELTDQYNKLAAKITEQLQSQGKNLDGFLAYNVSFTDADGNPVEPSDKVTYSFTYKEASSPELTDPAASTVTAAMIRTNKETSELELTELKAEEDKLTVETNESKQLTKVAFQSAATAAYTFVWSSTPAADDNENNENKVENGEVNNEEVNADTNTENTEENGEETPDQEQTKMIRVIADEVNLRVDPSTEAEVIATVDTDTQLPLIKTVTGEDEFTWYKVSYNETEAYVRSDMAEVVETEEQGIENEDANEEEADVQVEDEVTYSQTIENVVVTATAAKDVLPEDAKFVVTPIMSEDAQYEDIAARLEEKAENEEYSIAGFLAYDIYFLNSAGEKINPEDGKVKISMEYKNATAPEEVKESDAVQMDAEEEETSQENTEAKELSVSVMHFVEENGEVTSVVDMTKENGATVETNEAGEVQKAEFETESFSIFTITWTQKQQNLSGEVSVKVKYVNENGEEITATGVSSIKATKGTAIRLADYEPYISGYGFVKAQIGGDAYDKDNNDELKLIKVDQNANNDWTYSYSNDTASNTESWSTYTGVPTIYLVYSATKLSIQDDLMNSGNLIPVLTDELKNEIERAKNENVDVSYIWYKSINNGDFEAVDKIKVSGDNYNISTNEHNIDCLNVALDGGALSEDKSSVRYKVSLKIGEQESFSGEYNVRYYEELHNGGFETPSVTADHPGATNWQYSNENYKAQGGVWQTTGINAKGSSQWCDTDGADIEIIRADGTLSGDAGNGYAWQGAKLDAEENANGQFAELNCETAGALYQDVITYEGETLNFWLSHRARGRNSNTTEYDTMYVVMMPTSIAKTMEESNSQTPQQRLLNLVNSYYDISSEINASTNPTSESENVIYDNKNNGVLITRVVSDDTDWHNVQVSDRYIAKSAMTRFFFISGKTAVPTNNSGEYTEGNFLDRVGFSQNLPPANSGTFTLKVEKKFDGLESADIENLKDKMTFTIKAYNNDQGKTPATNAPLYGTHFTLKDMGNATSDGSYAKILTGELPKDDVNNKYIYEVEETNSQVSGKILTTTQTVVGGKVQSDRKSTLLGEKDSATFTVTNTYTPITLSSIMDSSKKAKVKNWDDRTYDITINASSKNTSQSTQTGKTVADIMLVLDVSGSMGEDISDEYIYVGENTNELRKNLYTDICYYILVNDTYMEMKWQWTGLFSGTWKVKNGSKWSDASNKDYNNCEIYRHRNRLDALKAAVNQFIESTAEKSEESNIGITAFNDTVVSTVGLGNVKVQKDTLEATVNNLNYSGGTSPAKGLEKAKQLLDAYDTDNPKYVILFTDGDPTGSYGSDWKDYEQTAAETQARELKTGYRGNDEKPTKKPYTVFTVGFSLTDRAKTFLAGGTYDSKEYPGIATTGCAKEASNAADLSQIFQDINSTITNNTDIAGATITDIIDPRFEIMVGDKVITDEVLTDGKYTLSDGEVITKRDDGTYQVEWKNQTIPNPNNTEHNQKSWTKTITVKAKDDFIGGNNILTNVGAGSKITVGALEKKLDQPKVNVKENLQIQDKTVTIYKGDTLPAINDIQNAILKISEKTSYSNGTISSADVQEYLSLQWYKLDEKGNRVNVDKSEIPEKPESDTEYYLEVTYTPNQESTDASKSNTTTNDGVQHYVESKKLCSGNNPFGTYKIIVKKGQIQITKNVTETTTEKDRTFKFDVKDEKNNSISDSPVTVTVEKGKSSGTVTIDNLSRGTYTVTEQDTKNYEIKEWGISTETDCQNSSSLDEKSITFTLGTDKAGKNVITDAYEYTSGGVKGVAFYTNEIVTELDLKKTNKDGTKDLPDAKFKLEKWEEPKDGTEGGWKSVSDNYDDITVNNGEGNKELTNLHAGRYKLTEIKAPNNHALLGSSIYFKVESGKVLLTDENGEVLKNANGTPANNGPSEMWTLDDNGQVLTIKNTEIYSLPSSGGPGIYGFTISGVAFITAALLLFINNKRKEDNIAG